MIKEFSEDQQEALGKIFDWKHAPRGLNRQYLTMGGYAGTGKTSLVSHLIDLWGHGVAVGALCGKAAHVLRSKGVAHAQTLHSLIYVPFETFEGVRFRKRQKLDPSIASVIVDEASMVDHIVLRDLLSFNLPVLFVGDHGQLEPIGTNPRLMVQPEIRLEKIHRQAMDNPILRLASAFREGRPVPKWKDKEGRLDLTHQNQFWSLISPEYQMICGFNKTRHKANAIIREALGFKELVEIGEKLICLKNNKVHNIFNGQQVVVASIGAETKNRITLEVITDDDRSIYLPCWKPQFGQNAIDDFSQLDVALMDYGYCLTAHKSQGSEWPTVLALEEIANVWDAKRWRYTVATRAKERLIYCF